MLPIIPTAINITQPNIPVDMTHVHKFPVLQYIYLSLSRITYFYALLPIYLFIYLFIVLPRNTYAGVIQWILEQSKIGLASQEYSPTLCR